MEQANGISVELMVERREGGEGEDERRKRVGSRLCVCVRHAFRHSAIISGF